MMGLLALFNGKKDPHALAREDPDSIGNILREWKYITDDELEKAVVVQKSQQQLGQILIDVTKGRLTNGQVEEAFMAQKIRRGKASRREISVFNSKKKRRLVAGIHGQFRNVIATLEEVGS